MKPRNMVFFIAVVLTIGMTYVLRAVNPPSPEQPGIEGNASLLNEDLSRIDNGGGRYTLIYQKDQNYMKNGVVLPYDLTIRASEVQGFDYEIDNKVRVLLSGTSDGAYRIEHEGDYVEFNLANVVSPVSGAIADGALKFTNVFPYTDVIQRPVNLGLKETLILKNSDVSRQVAYSISTNLTPTLVNDSEIRFLRNGEPRFVTTIPAVFDANRISIPCRVQLTPNGMNYRMAVEAITELDTLTAVFPVTIDPYSRIWQSDTSEVHDTTIDNNNPAKNWGASPWLDAQQYSSKKYRALIKFDGISNYIPAGSIIDSAKLDLYAEAVQTLLPNNVSLYRITKDWDEGDKYNAAGVCNWDTCRPAVPWDSGGGNYHGYLFASNTSSSTGWHYYDVDSLVQYWVNNGASSNKGMLLRQADESGNNHGPSYSSKNTSTTERRPRLRVYYTPLLDITTHIKYSSNYGSLQEAIDSTRSGDMLFIDEDYTLTSTVEIKRPNVTIVGTKSLIRPNSGWR